MKNFLLYNLLFHCYLLSTLLLASDEKTNSEKPLLENVNNKVKYELNEFRKTEPPWIKLNKTPKN